MDNEQINSAPKVMSRYPFMNVQASERAEGESSRDMDFYPERKAGWGRNYRSCECRVLLWRKGVSGRFLMNPDISTYLWILDPSNTEPNAGETFVNSLVPCERCETSSKSFRNQQLRPFSRLHIYKYNYNCRINGLLKLHLVVYFVLPWISLFI